MSAGILAVCGASLVFAGTSGFFRVAKAPDKQADPEIYTGTIQLTRSHSDTCRRMSFDNRTGGVNDKGTVACGTNALADGARPARHWTSNIDAVRGGFLKR